MMLALWRPLLLIAVGSWLTVAGALDFGDDHVSWWSYFHLVIGPLTVLAALIDLARGGRRR
jgi:hypothetical protein